jgi:hypothetical protein
VTYGSEAPATPHDGTTFVVFGASATPEPEMHGRFLAQHAGHETVAIVDEQALATQGADTVRIESRRAAWREVCADANVPVVFANLGAPDLGAIDAALDDAIGDRS